MEKQIKIISTKEIEVMRELAYVDRTPDLTKAGAIVSTDALIRVNVLKPITYAFKVGTNIIPEPLTFIDPETRKEVKESILSWPGVKHLVEAGVFEVYRAEEKMEMPTTDDEVVKPSTKKGKSLSDVAESTNK